MAYEVKYSDLIGDIADFPIEVVQRMVDLSHEQGKWDVDIGMITFQTNVCSAGCCGFGWGASIEGHSFWSSVIEGKRFERFFRLHPSMYCGKTIYIETDGHDAKTAVNELYRYTDLRSCLGSSKLDGIYYMEVNPERNTKPRFAMRGTSKYNEVVKNGVNICK